MKIQKFNENIAGQEFWLFQYHITSEDHYYALFSNEDSARNNVIETINDERKDYEPEYTDDMFFSDYNEAIKWHELYSPDNKVYYEKIELQPNFEGSEKLKKLKKIRNYRL